MAWLAVLLGASLLLAPVPAGAAERGAQQAAGPRKESPYARYAREHAKAAAKKPARAKAFPSPAGHRPRVGARAGRH